MHLTFLPQTPVCPNLESVDVEKIKSQKNRLSTIKTDLFHALKTETARNK